MKKSSIYRSILFVLLLHVATINAQTSCQGLTYSQGGWGAPNGNTATSYLNANFSSAFPSGLTIGCNNQLSLSSATDVISFLPSNTAPASLPSGTTTNPGGTYNNVLAGQLVALVLNATFDAYDASFSPASVALPNYSITSGPFSGMSVANFITLANSIIGGCSTQYSYSDINTAATNINQNYDNGTTDHGFLTCGTICNLSASVISGNILCNGGTTTVSINANGGTFPYTGDGVYSVSAGVSTFTVSDANGCTSAVSVNISEPTALTTNATSGNILCNGGTTTVSINANGGTLPYTGDGLQNVSAGVSTFTVSDANGCTSAVSINITEPTAIVAMSSAGNILCHGGSTNATITASGGTGEYIGTGIQTVYAGTSNFTVMDENSCPASISINVSEPSQLIASASSGNILCYGGSTSATISATGGTGEYTGTGIQTVYAGTSNFTVLDENSCEASVSINISEPALLVASASSGNILCNGGTTTVSVTANGGTSPYSGTTGHNVTAGTYTYQVVDANGCNASTGIIVSQPDLLVLSAIQSNVTCYGGTGTANATAVGGTGPYTFNWNTTPAQNLATAQLPVGTWNVSVLDANGCTNNVSGLQVMLLPCTGFVTATQGGWGAGCNGNNWGCYRNTNFSSAFPSGLVIGTGSRQLKLTSASAIDAFLPSSTTPKALNTGTLVNPGTSYKNVLAGQAVALKLNIGFDNWSSGFSSSNSSLSSLIISSGTFAGWSVSALLNEADNILGGVSSLYTASQINDVLNTINTNYDNGTQNLGYLTCACTTGNRIKHTSGDGEMNVSTIDNLVSDFGGFPNPFNTTTNIKFMLFENNHVSVNLFDMTGKLIQTLYSGEVNANEQYNVVLNGENLKEGIYFISLTSQNGVTMKKLILQN